MTLTGDLLCLPVAREAPARTRGTAWTTAATAGARALLTGAGDAGWRGYPLTTSQGDGWSVTVVGQVTDRTEAAFAEDVRRTLRQDPTAELPPDVPGHWAVVALGPDGTVHVLTDRFGTVQVAIGAGTSVAVGTEVAAVESAAGLPTGAEGLDWTALAIWCSLGFHAGGRTHRAGVRIVGPSSHARVAPDGTVTTHRVWRWHPDPDPARSTNALVGEIDDLLGEVLDAYLADGPLAVPVSGGLDSRTTVAVLTRPGAPHADLWAYSYGYGRLSPELAVARAVGAARDLPVAIRTVPPYLLDQLERAAAAVEGAQDLTQTRQLGVIDEVARHAPQVVAAHWGDVWFDTVGVGSEPMGADALLDKALAKFAKPADWLVQNLVAPHLDGPVEEVVRDALASELRPYLELEPPEWVLKAFKTDQWSARWTVPSLRAFHAGVQPRLPFYDSRVADWFLGVPVELHAGRALQRELLVRRHPDLARVPWEVTGAPLAGSAPVAARADLLVRRLGRGGRRLLRRPQPLRSWEVQLRGEDRTARAAALVVASPLAPLLDPRATDALWRDLAAADPGPRVGYPASMLVTLAAELGEATVRVVMLVPVFPRRSETFIVSKLVGLARRGLDVHLVCGHLDAAIRPGFPALAEVEDRIHPVAAGPGRTARTRGTLEAALATARAGDWGPARRANRARTDSHLGWWGEDSALARLAPDIVHAEFGTVGRDHARSATALGARLTVSFRGYDLAFAGLDEPGFYDEVWSSASAVHVLGEDLWQRALARGCPPSMPHRAIAPAVDLDALGPAPVRDEEARGGPDRPVRLLTVGRVEWKKGHEYGLRAVAELRRRGLAVHWTVVGGGEQLEALAFGVHELGLGDAVELVGPCPAEAIPGHLRDADLLLHPAVSEGFGNAVLEAQASALAVVVSDADGLAENVAHGETGLVVGRRDPLALADAVAALARDGATRAAMGRAGRRRVEEHFALPDQLDRWEAFYRDVHAGVLAR